MGGFEQKAGVAEVFMDVFAVVFKQGSLTPVGPESRMVSTWLDPGKRNGQHVQICAFATYMEACFKLVLKLSLAQDGWFWGCGLKSVGCS